MLLSLQMKLIAAAILSAGLLGGVYWVSTLPESYREEGRQEERGKATRVSDAAVIKRDLEFNDISSQLKTERTNRENDKAEHDKKFTQYVADARAGRRICLARGGCRRGGGPACQTRPRQVAAVKAGASLMPSPKYMVGPLRVSARTISIFSSGLFPA